LKKKICQTSLTFSPSLCPLRTFVSKKRETSGNEAAPAVYHYMLGKCEDVALHINKEDIPLTASSEPMVNLIKELEECDTADDLSNCRSDEHVWNLISACHWPDEVFVTLKNKGFLK